jgi:hypothetical protein
MGIPTTKVRLDESGKRIIIGDGGTLVFEAGAMIEGGVLSADEQGALSAHFINHYQITPAAASATAVHAAITLPATGTTVVTTAITNPDVPRTVTAKGNASGITGDVVVEGTNINDDDITDTIALNGSAEVEGVKAFKTVTSITVPAKTNVSGDTVSVGMKNKFGLPNIVYNAALLLVKLFNGSADTGTLAVDSDEIEKNLFAINGTPDGAKVLDLYYIN